MNANKNISGRLRERLRLAEARIRPALSGRTPAEIRAAIGRASRVILVNGTIGAALYFGVGPHIWFESTTDGGNHEAPGH